MNNYKLKNVLSALKKSKELAIEIKPYLSKLYDLDITHFLEIEGLCVDCKDYYMDNLPVSQDVIRILIGRVKKCHEILQELHAAAKKNNAKESFKLLDFRDRLLSCHSYLKKSSSGFKYEEKRVFIVSETEKITEDVTIKDKEVEKGDSKNQRKNDEAMKAQKMEFENQEIKLDHLNIWDHVPMEFEYEETYP